MSLQVWLPLIKDINNYGLSDLKFSAVSSSVTSKVADGKIGPNCYYNNAHGGGTLISDKTISLGQQLSMFCWFKFTQLNSGSSLGGAMGGQHRYPSNTGMGMTIKYVSATTGYLSLSTGTGSSRTYNYYCGKTLLQANTWYHGGFTYDGNTIKIYLNGQLDGTHSYTGQKNPEDYVNVFAWSFNAASGSASYSGYQLYGHMNDFRIYDHCLTFKEVRELAKGLILHYRLAGQYNANINLLKNSLDFTGASISDSIKGIDDFGNVSVGFDNRAATSGYKDFCRWSSARTVNAGEVYTVSFYARSKTKSKMITYFYNNNTGVQVSKGVSSLGTTTTSTDGNHTWQLTPQWTRYWITYTFNSNTTALAKTLLFRLQYGNEAEISLVKLESGDTATPWTPAASDSIYDAYVKEYDCSGYGNDGTITGTLVTSSETPRNNVCTTFIGSQYINAGQGAKVKDAITVNYWAYSDSWGNFTRAISCTESGGWTIYINNGKMTFICGTGASSNTYLYAADSKAASSIPAGWHMFTGTYDGFTAKLYIDGVLVGSSATSSSKTPIYYVGNTIWVGAEAGSGTTSHAGSLFTGRLSDISIYATALASIDVEKLYQRSLAIDNEGNAFSGSYNELKENKLTVSKNLVGGHASEISGQMKVKALDDGSVWARIHWLDVTTDGTYFTNATEVGYCIDKTNRFSLMNIAEEFSSQTEIPKDYTQLEYIESSGTQYINTGYYWKSDNVKVILDANVTSNSAYQSLFGNEEPYNGGRYFAIIPHGSNGSFGMYAGTSGSVGTATITVGNRFKMECETGSNKLTVKVNGAQQFSASYPGSIQSYANTTSTNSTKGQIYLFSNHNSGSSGASGIQRVGAMRVYNFQLHDNGVMVRNLIPCKNASGVVGMYDTMTQTFYGNSGSGSFIAGPETGEHIVSDGCYEFMLTYPKLSSTEYNRWIQSSPPSSSTVVGFKAIKTSWSSHNGGIRKNGSQTVYNCDTGSTWFAPIGQTSRWNSTRHIPAADGNSTTETELWIRVYPNSLKDVARIYKNDLYANKIYER